MKDADIRPVLDGQLTRKYAGQDDTVIVHELGVHNGLHRIDIAVVNGVLSGYEIKSERDTLKRLPQQAEAYSAVFDHMTLVVHERHLNEAVMMVPEWWGVRVVSQPKRAVKFQQLRKAKANSTINPYAVAALVWRGGSLSILKAHSLDRGLRSATRERLWAAMATGLPVDVLRQEVRTAVRRQQAWLAAQAARQQTSIH